MAAKAVFFDLDGTLSDSGEGIINCASLALRHFGLPVPDREAMRVFVGPPLRDTFVKFGVPLENIEEAVRVYRSRYNTVGKFENFTYDGIPELLSALKNDGCRLFVATSKPEEVSLEILEKLGLIGYFERVCGALGDGSRDSKAAVIAYLLEQTGSLDDTLMVGDTAFDVIGAAAHGIKTVGVSWGYGNVCDMQSAGVAAVADTPDQLLKLIRAFPEL